MQLERLLPDLTLFGAASYTAQSLHAIGQVAQLVERGPEKAGVGGSIPSLATISFNNLASLKTRLRIARTVAGILITDARLAQCYRLPQGAV